MTARTKLQADTLQHDDFVQDSFVKDRLPPAEQWPVILPLESVPMNGPLNCVTFLLDRHLDGDGAARPALKSGDRSWTYGELSARVARIARLMRETYAIAPGQRVLLRGGNSPEVVAIWLAVQRIGAVAVTTMSLLRATELTAIIAIAQPALAFCETDLASDLHEAIARECVMMPVVEYGADTGPLYEMIESLPADFPVQATQADDVSIIAFTSGTTGKPKATIHFHRDILAICETVSRHILQPGRDDIFIGTAPLAFTFGLGGLLAFPLYAGACSILHGRYTPAEFAAAIARYRATICFTVPTYYQQIMRLEGLTGLQSLRLAVSSGEALPLPVREAWQARTGLALTEVFGSTEMLHAFVGATGDDIRPGFIGRAIPGYEAAVLDENGNRLPAGEIGKFAIRGPTGCRYMDDPRQSDYVRHGWNLTGDACSMSEDGYIAYHTRYDDMIISSGYNISGLEVENALLEHADVAECAVIGETDADRGQIVAAYVVAKCGTDQFTADDFAALRKRLQDHVKQVIAPYKYPRVIHFTDKLPRNESGKIQRFRLRGSL